jgi:hypothetical protein
MNLTAFDPGKLAQYEKENYVAYYQKRWLRLLRVSIRMVQEAYQFSLWQAIYGAYLIARAEIAFAPFPENDVPLAEAYMRRFFTFLNRVHGLKIDVENAAQVEVNWWIVHRNLFAQDENQELVEALARHLVVVYGIAESGAREAAYHRAQGMLYSDKWVRSGMEPGSPLLLQEEKALSQAYQVLRAALTSQSLQEPAAIRTP